MDDTEDTVLSFAEALAYARARKIVLPDEYAKLVSAMQRSQAATISGLASIEQVQHVMGLVTKAMSDGSTFADFKRAVKAGELSVDLPLNKLDNIFRTNIQMAYNRGRWEQQASLASTRPYLMYDAINDSRTRPSHLAMDGVILPRSHPWWQTHYAPNGYRCRCTVISLTEKQAMKRGISPAPPEGVDPDEGWDFNPGTDYTTGVQRALAKKAETVPAPVIEKVKRQAREKKAPRPFTLALNKFKQYQDDPALAGLIDEQFRLKREIAKVKGFISKTVPLQEELAQVNAKLMPLLKQRRAAGLQMLELDEALRGDKTLMIKGKVPKHAEGILDEALDFLHKTVNGELLPKGLRVSKAPVSRAYYDPVKKTVHVSDGGRVSTLIHEIVHDIEFRSLKTSNKSKKFRDGRAKGELPKTLRSLTLNDGYRQDEIALEDSWAKKGGVHYTGKVYGTRATEVLTTGVERLFSDPVQFYNEDPDFFTFLLEVFHG